MHFTTGLIEYWVLSPLDSHCASSSGNIYTAFDVEIIWCFARVLIEQFRVKRHITGWSTRKSSISHVEMSFWLVKQWLRVFPQTFTKIFYNIFFPFLVYPFGSEGCPIHANRYESSKAIDELLNRKSIRGMVLWYRRSEKPSLMIWKRIPEVNLQVT